MKGPAECFTLPEIEGLITEISRDTPGLRAQAESREWTTEERWTSQKLNAMCIALDRRREIQQEIDVGIRSPVDGELNFQV